jgi:excisionase family DNA binding protein
MGAAPKNLVALTALDTIAAQPSVLERLPFDTLTALRARAAATLAVIESAQLLAINRPDRKTTKNIEREPMLTTDEAAALLHKSRRWIYRNAHHLPFVRRVSRKSILISEPGLQQWLAAHH